MSDTIRQQIVTAFDTRMKTIKTANGYETNLGNSVYEWLQAPLQEDDPVSLNYRDRSNVTVRAVGCHEHRLTMEVVLAITKAATPAQVRKMIADVIVCVGTDPQWSGLAEDTRPVSDEEIEIEHRGRKIAGVSLKFEIQHNTAPFDPYTAA